MGRGAHRKEFFYMTVRLGFTLLLGLVAGCSRREPGTRELSAQGWMDVTATLDPARTPVYQGDAPMKFDFLKDMRKGDILTLSVYSLGAHSGTHIDAPMHFVANGAPIDQVALDPLIGAARVIDIPDSVRAIDARELNRHDWRGAKRVLFRTRSTLRGWMDSSRSTRTSRTSPRTRRSCSRTLESCWSALTTSRRSNSALRRRGPTRFYSAAGFPSWRGWTCVRCTRATTISSCYHSRSAGTKGRPRGRSSAGLMESHDDISLLAPGVDVVGEPREGVGAVPLYSAGCQTKESRARYRISPLGVRTVTTADRTGASRWVVANRVRNLPSIVMVPTRE